MPAAPVEAGAPFSLEAAAEKIRALGVPGVIVYVRDGDKTTTAAAGVADIASGRKMTGEEAWRIASVTKLITGIVIQGLVHEKLISVDDKISKYLPRVVPLANKITISQLLNHTSGVPDYLSGVRNPINVSARLLGKELVRNRSRRQLLADANRQKRAAPPGRQHEYSNTNYLLLEMLIEKVTGTSFRELVMEEVVGPLGLKRTGFPDSGGRVPMPHIRGYVPGDSIRGPFTDTNKLVDVTSHDYFRGADGGLYSTVFDLALMMDALWSDKMIPRELIRAMVADLKEDHDGTYKYGLGIAAFPTVCSKAVFGHEGRDLGIFTAAVATLDGKRQMIVVANAVPDYVPKLDATIADLRDRVFCK
jgi:D-alanyl-D-alanine carboxypeptidase